MLMFAVFGATIHNQLLLDCGAHENINREPQLQIVHDRYLSAHPPPTFQPPTPPLPAAISGIRRRRPPHERDVCRCDVICVPYDV